MRVERKRIGKGKSEEKKLEDVFGGIGEGD